MSVVRDDREVGAMGDRMARRAIPMLSCENVGAAVAWLEDEFGSHESALFLQPSTG